MDLSQTWNNFSKQAQGMWGDYSGRAQSAWNDYKNPVLSDASMDFLTPQQGFSTPTNAGYSPWGNTTDFKFGDALNMDKWATNTAGGLSDTYAGPNLGEAGALGGLATDFRNSSFKDQASAVTGLATAGIGAYNAYNTTKMAKDQFDFQKQAWNKNYETNKNLTNASLSDRQAARVASNPSAYQSVDSYMKKYGVK